jgi:hypothetical protein
MEYKKAPSNFQLAVWTIEHTQLLDKLVKERAGLQEGTYVENQNSFRVKRPSGLVIAGKPDLVTINSSGQCKVYDAKTGNPRQSDIVQVMLYMMCLPYSSPLYKGKRLSGCVVYKNGTRSQIPEKAIDEAFTEQVTYFLNILESDKPPERIPAPMECQFCEIGLPDCENRQETDDKVIVQGEDPEISV